MPCEVEALTLTPALALAVALPLAFGSSPCTQGREHARAWVIA
jgi:hypothetical protein